MKGTMSTPIVIFDIDGTLCDTFAVDEECFRRACGDVLQVDWSALDWQSAPHITDAGICDWFWRRHLERPPTPVELNRVASLYVAFLREELERDPTRFKATRGAATLLKHLADSGWEIAVATGGWSAPAQLKLTAAGLDPDLLSASSDDALERLKVFQLAETRARSRVSGQVGRTVLVGDGLWDIRVASTHGWCFLGITSTVGEDQLIRAGARVVIRDFGDPDHVTEALRSATIPQPIEKIGR